MINRVTLVGRLGQDVELRYTPSGVPVARLSVATDASYKDRDGQRVDKTDWHRVIAYQKIAENCANYLGKGSLIYLEGSLSTREWVDDQEIKRFITEITARKLRFLDRRRDDENMPHTPQSAEEPSLEDLPPQGLHALGIDDMPD